VNSTRLTERSLFQNFSGTLSVAALGSLMLLLAACAAAPQQVVQEEKEYVWPGPPLQPVIRWEREFRTEKEFSTEANKNSSWKDALLGEEEEDSRFVYLITPYGIHADREGRILVADPGIVGIAVFDLAQDRFFSAGKDGRGQFSGALGVATDSNGTIYATNSRDKNVMVFDLNGNYLRSFGNNEQFGRPVGIAVDDQRGRIYVTDTLKHFVHVFDMEGNEVARIGEHGEEAAAGDLNFPLQVTLDGQGRLYVVDSMNFRVQMYDADGSHIRSIGRQGDRAGELARPRGVAVDSLGHVYVSDASFNNVQIFDQQGRHLMTFGARQSTPGGFFFPSGIAIDSKDRIYVADQMNKRVQVFQFLGVPDIEASENIDSSP
jgi:DNA-binding beta-propeller fold protein YncE